LRTDTPKNTPSKRWLLLDVVGPAAKDFRESLHVILKYHFMRTELVTTLKRKASELLADIEKDGAPILITQHGLPAAYLVDVEAYDALQQRIGLLEGIARGEKAVEDGRVVTRAQAKQRMSRWLK
jgi:prevent-host-death family protein